MKNAKMAASKQNGRLPVGRRKSVQETFLCVLVDFICIPNFVCLQQSGRRGGHFKPRPLPFGHAHFRKFQIPKIFTEPDVCAKICEFSWSFRPSKMHSFRHKERRRIKTASGGERALAPACGPPPVAVGFLLRSTSCRSQEFGPRDFLVRLCRLYAYRISFAYDKVGGTAVFVALPWQRGK